MSGLTGIDASLLPADVRRGTSADRKAYGAALDFERALLGELTKAMAETAKPADEETEDSGTATYRSMLPERLADSLVQAGGVGLARSLYDSLKEDAK
jgi:Rod binding domain-containing protein